jgi:hypothetical protein
MDLTIFAAREGPVRIGEPFGPDRVHDGHPILPDFCPTYHEPPPKGSFYSML